MARRFETTRELALTGNSREDLYELLRTLDPTEELVNELGLQVLDGKIHLGNRVSYARLYTKTYADFAVAGLTSNIELAAMPAGAVVDFVKIKHTTAWTGGAISSLKLDVGLTGAPAGYISQFDAKQAVSDTAYRIARAPLWDSLALTGLTSIADGAIASSVSQADGVIGALPVSASYNQMEMTNLRNACETLGDNVRALAAICETVGDNQRAMIANMQAMYGGTSGGAGGSSLRLAATAAGGNLNTLTQGAVSVFVGWSQLEN